MNIIIADTAIRQSQSLYNLNDLHKAAGNEQRHKPANWLALQQVSELIAELCDAGNPASKENQQVIQVIKGGKNQGTFVCKELVYAYATWISPAFFLKVIRTFDAVANEQPEIPRRTTPDERAGLRQAVTMLTTKRGLMHDEAYRLIHQRFNVTHIEEIPAEQLPQAVEYIHRLALEGELLPPREDADRSHRVAAVAMMTRGYLAEQERRRALDILLSRAVDALEYLEQAQHRMREVLDLAHRIGKSGGKVWDGLYEAQAHLGFDRAIMDEGIRQAEASYRTSVYAN